MNFPDAFKNPQYFGQDMFGVKELKGNYELVAQKWLMAVDTESERALSRVY